MSAATKKRSPAAAGDSNARKCAVADISEAGEIRGRRGREGAVDEAVDNLGEHVQVGEGGDGVDVGADDPRRVDSREAVGRFSLVHKVPCSSLR